MSLQSIVVLFVATMNGKQHLGWITHMWGQY